MSPVAQSRGHAGKALAVAGVGVVVALAIAFGVAQLASQGKVDVRLGSDTFAQQDAEDAAEKVAEDGPIIYPDTAGGDRDIVLQHLGDDPAEGCEFPPSGEGIPSYPVTVDADGKLDVDLNAEDRATSTTA